MAKKKKSTPDLKIQQAQYRNNYLRELKKYYDQIHPDLWPCLTDRDLKALFLSRGTAVRSVSGDTTRVPGWMLKHCDDFVRKYMHVAKLDIVPSRFSVTAMEYSIYIMPLEAWSEELAPRFQDCPWFNELFGSAREERLNKYETIMNYFALLLMGNLSHPAYQMCNVEYKIFIDTTGETPRPHQYFQLRGYNPREAVITFDDNKDNRIALELVYNYHSLQNPENKETFSPVTLPASRFGISNLKDNDKPLPAFILRHALDRLEERLGCLEFGYASAQIIESLLYGKAYPQSKTKFLVEYHIEKVKAGYLQVDVLEEVILIRTFLFLTNSSTPEGKKLREHLGLHKEDIKYFNIDKLSPLMETDLLVDEDMCNKLREAGCESLIELCEVVKESPYWNYSEEKKELAAKLRKYMMEGEEPDGVI